MKKTFILSITILALCLSLVAVSTASAGGGTEQDAVLRGIFISNAVGKAFSGEECAYTGATVDFARKVKPSNFLVPNRAAMVQGSVLEDTGKRMSGTLRYADPLGRIATYMYDVGYSTKGAHQYRITKVGVKTYEPVQPGFEGYFIPADRITMKKMQRMDMGTLMEFARANGERPEEGINGPVKDYHVVVFCMHRLRGNAKWAVMHGEKLGASWSKGDWHAAAITASFGLNTPDLELFRVFYAPSKRSPYKGKLFQVGGLANQFVPPVTGPVRSVNVSPETRQLLDEYAAKTQPAAR